MFIFSSLPSLCSFPLLNLSCICNFFSFDFCAISFCKFSMRLWLFSSGKCIWQASQMLSSWWKLYQFPLLLLRRRRVVVVAVVEFGVENVSSSWGDWECYKLPYLFADITHTQTHTNIHSSHTHSPSHTHTHTHTLSWHNCCHIRPLNGRQRRNFWFGAAEAFNTKAGSLSVWVCECALCVWISVCACGCVWVCVFVCVKHANNISKSISVCA